MPRCMLKENANSCAAVKHFVDKFDKLKSDQTQLEVGIVNGRAEGSGYSLTGSGSLDVFNCNTSIRLNPIVNECHETFGNRI